MMLTCKRQMVLFTDLPDMSIHRHRLQISIYFLFGLQQPSNKPEGSLVVLEYPIRPEEFIESLHGLLKFLLFIFCTFSKFNFINTNLTYLFPVYTSIHQIVFRVAKYIIENAFKATYLFCSLLMYLCLQTCLVHNVLMCYL